MDGSDPSAFSADVDELLSLADADERRLSRSLLSGLLVLACFPQDGSLLGVAQLARKLKMSPSATHRYVSTLLSAGLLERDPETRRYRLAVKFVEAIEEEDELEAAEAEDPSEEEAAESPTGS